MKTDREHIAATKVVKREGEPSGNLSHVVSTEMEEEQEQDHLVLV
jgi:hypothetical protein